MESDSSKEDRLIRAVGIAAGSAVMVIALTAATVIAVMISYNFNFLEWME